MKLVLAYIRHRKLEDVFTSLKKEGYCCMTFIECEGTGEYSDHSKEHISNKYSFALAYRVVKLEVLVDDKDVNNVISIIRASGRTGYSGDGIIFTSPLEEVYKIKTNEKGFSVI